METLLPQPHLQKGPVFIREVHGGALILIPHGPLGNLHESAFDQETTQLLEFIGSVSAVNLVIDLQDGDYVGTAFLGAVVRLWKRTAQSGGRLALCHVSEQVFQILRMTKMHTIWPIHVSRDDALRAVGG